MKQLSTKVMRFRILGEKYIVCNLSLGQCSWGQFSSGELCRQQIIWKAIFLRGNFQRDIVKGQLYLGSFSVSNHPGDNYQPAIILRQFCSWAILLGGNCPWSNYPWWQLPGVKKSGGTIIQGAIVRRAIFLGAICPDTEKFPSYLGGIPTKSSEIPPRLAGSLLIWTNYNFIGVS